MAKKNIKKPTKEAIILALDTQFVESRRVFIWPFSKKFMEEFDNGYGSVTGTLKQFEHQQEWGVWIDEPIPISGINFCGRKEKKFRPTRKIVEGNPFIIEER